MANIWLENMANNHRLPKPRSAREEDPRPIMMRFMTRKDRRRVITERSKLKKYNKDNVTHIYINEDLTTYRAGLFRTVRKLLAQKHFNTAWTFNGNIKVTTRTNVVKSITTVDDIKALLPDVDIGNLNWLQLPSVFISYGVFLSLYFIQNHWHIQLLIVCTCSILIHVSIPRDMPSGCPVAFITEPLADWL